MTQNRRLERAQPRARLESEFVDHQLAPGSVDLQRLDLTPRPVEREHQLRTHRLAERMLRDKALQLRDQRGVTPEREGGVDARLDGDTAELVEAVDIDARPSASRHSKRSASSSPGATRSW